ncbi:apolipoprotein N-acyltransferase [bacterium]|nr:apolipoprotein N-acyltransferase [bacterium]
MKKTLLFILFSSISAFLISCSAPSIDFFPLAWFSFIPAFYYLEDKSNRHSLWFGFVMGTVINLHAFVWLIGTIKVFGGLPIVISIILYVLLSFIQGIRYGIFFWIYKKFNLRKNHFLITPILYAVLEFFIPMLFNWTIGNTQYLFYPFIQIVDIFGISFLSFIMVSFSYSLYILFKDRNRVPIFYITSLIIMTIIYGVVSIQIQKNKEAKSEKINIGVVQANIGIFEKRDSRQHRENTLKFYDSSLKLKEMGAELIVWPESSMVAPFQTDRKSLKGFVAPNLEIPVIFGGLTYQRGGGDIRGAKWYNTAIFVDKNEDILALYNKQYLLAFGEYMPFSETFPSLKKIIKMVGNITPGDEIVPFILNDRASFGIFICYEDIIESFGNKVAKHKPNIYLNLTNDAWFLESAAADLHKMIALFRTIEHRRYLIRATNTGRSAIIDSMGIIRKELPLYEKGEMNYLVPILNGDTFYEIFGKYTPYIELIILIFYFIKKGRLKISFLKKR